MTTKEKAERVMDFLIVNADKKGRHLTEIEKDIYEIAKEYLKLLDKEKPRKHEGA